MNTSFQSLDSVNKQIVTNSGYVLTPVSRCILTPFSAPISITQALPRIVHTEKNPINLQTLLPTGAGDFSINSIAAENTINPTSTIVYISSVNKPEKRKNVWLTDEERKIIKDAYITKQQEDPSMTLRKFCNTYTLSGTKISKSTLSTIIKPPPPPKKLKRIHLSRNHPIRQTIVEEFNEAQKKEKQQNYTKLTKKDFLKSKDSPHKIRTIQRWLRESKQTSKRIEKAELTSSLFNEGKELTIPSDIHFNPDTKFTNTKPRTNKHRSPEEILRIATEYGESKLNRSQFAAQYATEHPEEYFTIGILAAVLQQAKKLKASSIEEFLAEADLDFSQDDSIIPYNCAN